MAETWAAYGGAKRRRPSIPLGLDQAVHSRAAFTAIATRVGAGAATEDASPRTIVSCWPRPADWLYRSASRPWLSLTEFADDAAGVEVNKQLAQLVESCRSELLFKFGLDLGDGFADRPRRGVSSLGEVDALGALVFGVVVTGEVSQLLHLSQQVVHRLLAHAGVGCEL